MQREGTAMMCDGRLFHRRAAATGNALSPTVDRRVCWTSRGVDEAERSRRLASVSAGRYVWQWRWTYTWSVEWHHTEWHTFDCLKHPTDLTVHDLWDQPAEAADFIYFMNYQLWQSDNMIVKVKVKRYSSSWQVISELRGTTCHTGSHSVTCHPTQVNPPRLIPARQSSTRFTYPGGMEGWVHLGDLLHTEKVYPPADGHPSK